MNRIRRWGFGIVAVLTAMLTAGWALGTLKSRPGHAVNAEGVMLGGFDPVSYFPEGGGAPRPGEERWTARVDGRSYRFASATNRGQFVENPRRYEPQYGGWCAYAVANGYKFDADPESYLVENDRLFVFYDGVLGDARTEFQKEGVERGIRNADTNWPTLIDEEPPG